MKQIKVKQPDNRSSQSSQNDVPTEILADSIVAIAEGIRKLRAGRLNERALLLLIQHAAPAPSSFRTKPVSQKDVRAVLDGIENLEAAYLKKKPANK